MRRGAEPTKKLFVILITLEGPAAACYLSNKSNTNSLPFPTSGPLSE